jgi:CDP-glucose 4,6-dehydratase
MGTVNVLEAVRYMNTVRTVVSITSDKCYENKEWPWGYRENEPLGGYDPYSNSKGCAELVTAGYRCSYFNPEKYAQHGVAIASARAGNVIGGGDWALDRLIPDMLRAIGRREAVLIRNPAAIRPWQHVLEPLSGYLMLTEKLYTQGPAYAEAWNFGPHDVDAVPVEWIIERITQVWGQDAAWKLDGVPQPHEATYLKLDCSKARAYLGWHPRWNIGQTIEKIVDWHKAYDKCTDMKQMTLSQINAYQNS